MKSPLIIAAALLAGAAQPAYFVKEGWYLQRSEHRDHDGHRGDDKDRDHGRN